MKNSLLKSIRFNMDDESDRKLYEWLAKLPRGEFSTHTKQYWVEEMADQNKRQEKMRRIEEENENYQMPESLKMDIKKRKESEGK